MVVKSLLKFKLSTIGSFIKPPINSGVYYFYLILIISTVSCSSFIFPLKSSKKANLINGYVEMTEKDFEDHLASLKAPFLNTPGVKIKKVDGTTKKYLHDLLNQIILNNEIFFEKLEKAGVTIIDTEAPLHFSLPKGEIFLSKGLITKYMKHESMLVSVLAYELVRSEKLIYPKQTIIPLGYITQERMILLNRLQLEEKMEVHKWAHHLTVRTGYEGEYYLSWLQTQNRNTADFILQVGDANLINREESLFKAFLIKTTEDNVITKKNSSKRFYTFLNKIRDGIQ